MLGFIRGSVPSRVKDTAKVVSNNENLVSVAGYCCKKLSKKVVIVPVCGFDIHRLKQQGWRNQPNQNEITK